MKPMKPETIDRIARGPRVWPLVLVFVIFVGLMLCLR